METNNKMLLPFADARDLADKCHVIQGFLNQESSKFKEWLSGMDIQYDDLLEGGVAVDINALSEDKMDRLHDFLEEKDKRQDDFYRRIGVIYPEA